jgi:GR25 family glycosyltransferase involved in LPS biosynthesis
MEKYKVYCLSFKNDERKISMKSRFEKLNIDYIFYDGVDFNDKRIHPDSYKQCWSCMYGHLDMIQMFYNDNNINYGIFCEDDIYIHKDFKEFIPQIIKDFQYLKLDVLLLGYLIPFIIKYNYINFEVKDNNFNSNNFKYHNFPNELWGTQMYMLSKEYAKKILENYNELSNYSIRTLTDNSLTPFSADWTITKDGNRALIMPCLAVEDNKKIYHNDPNQERFHKICHEIQYDPNVFI